jgi:hypothetical protein
MGKMAEELKIDASIVVCIVEIVFTDFTPGRMSKGSVS